ACGSHVAADGFSAPYRIAMALGTALYGFLGVLLAFRIARQHVAEHWAALAAISVWWASSLPVYMYFNPSWSHAHSAFTVALFLGYGQKPAQAGGLWQWPVLGGVAGLMIDVYYPNATARVVILIEALRHYRVVWFRESLPSPPALTAGELRLRHGIFAIVL